MRKEMRTGIKEVIAVPPIGAYLITENGYKACEIFPEACELIEKSFGVKLDHVKLSFTAGFFYFENYKIDERVGFSTCGEVMVPYWEEDRGNFICHELAHEADCLTFGFRKVSQPDAEELARFGEFICKVGVPLPAKTWIPYGIRYGWKAMRARIVHELLK